MVPAPPTLPTQFPCWCRAVYSWGGESTRDLGFIEGDLIECLNAGDGSWWTGRLLRNKTIGVFPSNFVEVLPDNFRPVSRSISPMVGSNAPSPSSSIIQKAKAKPFRKPFEAYAKAPHYTTAKTPEIIREVPKSRHSRKESPRNVQNLAQESSSRVATPPDTRRHRIRASSPAPPANPYTGRAPSPAPPMHNYAGRAPSPAPSMNNYAPRAHSPAPPLSSYNPRSHSPAPPMGNYAPRSHSPIPPLSSYAPRSHSPAPPMNNYAPRAHSPAPPMNNYVGRAHSPAPPMHSYAGRAPSPAPPMHNYGGRAPSPAPSHMQQDYAYRAPSPAPPTPMQHHYGSRAPSPAPSHMQDREYRAPSPAPPAHHFSARTPSPAPSFGYMPYRPAEEVDSPPPPPPPPHRHVVSRSAPNVSYDNVPPQTGYHTPRVPSPCPPSPAGEGFTPSPLREAMDGVIEQLDALGMKHHDDPQVPLDPWSPESFDMVHHRSRRKAQARPQTSLGVTHQDSGYESHGGDSSQDRQLHNDLQEEPHLPQLTNYVERMESRLRKMHQHSSSMGALDQQVEQDDPPPPPPKGRHQDRPKSSMGDHAERNRSLRKRRSAYEIGAQLLGRTSTTKTNSTNASSGNQSTTTQSTNRSLMSGTSAGGISATSAGSLARKNLRARSALGFRDGDDDLDMNRPITPFSGVSYHPSHSTSAQQRPQSQAGFHDEGIAAVGGLVQPATVKPKKSNFIKRILEATKTGVASGRSSIATGSNNPNTHQSLQARGHSSSLTAIAGGVSTPTPSAARDMGLNNGVDWVQVRRDVNRSNTLSRKERDERHERCLMMDYPALDPVDELYASVEGDEGADGLPVLEPINYQAINLSQVDKNSRFISNLPPMITSVTLATTYVCRPYRSDVQRLRAIFTWVAEKIHWEEDFEGEVDTRRVIQTKRGCAEEYAVLVHEMCAAIGIHSEIIRGYLKTPGELPETAAGGGGGGGANATMLLPRPNHWWNAVLVDDAWRLMDCCLASPSNPRRGLYATAASPSAAEPWWFLARPLELCWTHAPAHPAHQHLCPPAAPETLLHLPGACPPYFRHGLSLVDYNTALTRIEDLEMVHVRFRVPPDVEVVAEVEVRAFARDADGDLFESGDVVRKRALAQAEWCTTTTTTTTTSTTSSEPSSGPGGGGGGGIVKRYTVKALLPGDEGTGVLKIYAGKRGLMHSIKDIPHPLAFALPIIHTGENPPYEFVTRHPTPHAQRHDIYVVQPQCQRLALNNTFVFAIRQHPALSAAGGSGSSSMTPSSNPNGGGGGGGGGGSTSPVPPFARPTSAMSMMSTSAAGTSSSSAGISSVPPSSATGTIAGKKPAKLAIQTPGGKILRLMRKDDQHRRGILGGGRSNSSSNGGGGGGDEDPTVSSDGGTWETIIKCSERGVWRGLVLADRTARWCVFAEWVCVG